MRLRTRKSSNYKKQHSAASKYASKMKERASKKPAEKEALANDQKQIKLLNNLFKDDFASVDELIEMNKIIVDYC